jgi:hypothetical protein
MASYFDLKQNKVLFLNHIDPQKAQDSIILRN